MIGLSSRMRNLKVRGVRAMLLPRVGRVDFGDLDRLTPISEVNGFDRGQPIDRYYIERFLDACDEAGDIRGRVLEIGDDRYSRRVRGDVERIDVLDVDSDNDRATIIGDLARPDGLPRGAFDAVLCVQTLLLVDDPAAAAAGIHQMLRPGGVAIVTVPGISWFYAHEADAWTDQWRFTQVSAARLFEQAFPGGSVAVRSFGNVLASAAYLFGLAKEDLGTDRLDARDPRFELVVTVRAQKAWSPEVSDSVPKTDK